MGRRKLNFIKRVPVGLSVTDDKHLDELCEYYNACRATFMRNLLRITYKAHVEKLKKEKGES